MLLGIAGLLPAIAACIAVLWGLPDIRALGATVCATYAAIILSFLGGAWFGIVSAEGAPRRVGAVFCVSVLPSLAGWAALLLDRGAGLMALGLLFLAVLPGDLWLSRNGIAPGWWPKLRVPLSLGMSALTLVAGARLTHG